MALDPVSVKRLHVVGQLSEDLTFDRRRLVVTLAGLLARPVTI
jgi:hypothetical protein